MAYYLLKRIFHYQPKIEDFIPAAKKELKEKIIKAIDPNFKYTAHPELLKTEYWNGQFHRKADNFYLRDRLFGRIGQIYFESLFAYVSIEVKKTDSDGHSYMSHETIFRGFFMSANYPKKFKGEIIISPDNNESVWGTYISRKLQARNKKLGKLIYLENPEFERHFKVYCNP